MGGGAASFRLRPGYVPHADGRGNSVKQTVKVDRCRGENRTCGKGIKVAAKVGNQAIQMSDIICFAASANVRSGFFKQRHTDLF